MVLMKAVGVGVMQCWGKPDAQPNNPKLHHSSPSSKMARNICWDSVALRRGCPSLPPVDSGLFMASPAEPRSGPTGDRNSGASGTPDPKTPEDWHSPKAVAMSSDPGEHGEPGCTVVLCVRRFHHT